MVANRIALPARRAPETLGFGALLTDGSVSTRSSSTFMCLAEHGLVDEHWEVVDMLTMMQQLGVNPDGPAALPTAQHAQRATRSIIKRKPVDPPIAKTAPR